MELIEILEREERIFMDGSIMACAAGDFLVDIYDYKTYNAIDDLQLDRVLADFEKALEFLIKGEESKKLIVIPEVTGELENLQDRIVKKLKYLNKRERTLSKREKGEKHNRDEESIEKLNELGFKVNDVLRLTGRQIQYKNSSDSVYNNLVELFTTIAPFVLVEKSFERYHGFKMEPEIIEKEKQKTDERITAAAIYCSLVEKQKSSIVSRDTDFISLLGKGLYLLRAGDLDGNKCLIEPLIDNPVTLYLPIKGKQGNFSYDSELSTSKVTCEKKFSIWGISNERNNDIKKHLEYLLSQLNRNLLN